MSEVQQYEIIVPIQLPQTRPLIIISDDSLEYTIGTAISYLNKKTLYSIDSFLFTFADDILTLTLISSQTDLSQSYSELFRLFNHIIPSFYNKELKEKKEIITDRAQKASLIEDPEIRMNLFDFWRQ